MRQTRELLDFYNLFEKSQICIKIGAKNIYVFADIDIMRRLAFLTIALLIAILAYFYSYFASISYESRIITR